MKGGERERETDRKKETKTERKKERIDSHEVEPNIKNWFVPSMTPLGAYKPQNLYQQFLVNPF